MTKSQQLYAAASKLIPGGVNSPVRAFNGVGGNPLFIKRGEGAYVVDADDNMYIDYVGSWGPLIAGHAHPYVLQRVNEALTLGWSFGAPTEIELKLAEKVCELMPAIEMVRFVSSGTEAAMSAIRLARGYTKRDKFIKFTGCYHGHADCLLVAAGSGGLTLGVPNSAGVPKSVVEHTLTAEFNNLEQVKQLFAANPDEIAGVMVEPITGNMNCVLPEPGFLAGLRELCDRYGSVLIFDEVMTGFRVALGGASALYQIKPDLTVLAKVVGGGFPVGAFGGKKEIMQCVAPLGPVYQAGTLSGNPIAMSAGLATLELVSAPSFYEKLSAQTQKLMTGLAARAKAVGIPIYTNAIGGMFGFYFTTLEAVRNEAEVKQSDVALFQQFFHAMLQAGIYFAPSAYEAGFVSSAHGDLEIEKTLCAAEKVFASLATKHQRAI